MFSDTAGKNTCPGLQGMLSETFRAIDKILVVSGTFIQGGEGQRSSDSVPALI